MKRLGIKELAKLLSLNPSTVSRALADHPDIKPETKDRVKAAALEFNYQPNLHARYFRKKNSRLIAVILQEYNMFFVPGLLEAIDKYLDTEGYRMIVFFTKNEIKKESEIINHCLSWVVDGVLISTSDPHSTNLKQLHDAEIPFLIINPSFNISDPQPAVMIDDYHAAYEATNYLIQKDKINILGIFGSPDLYVTNQRLKGFKACLNDHKITYSDYDIIFHEKGLKNIETKLRSTPYNGTFIMSDELLMITYPILIKNRQIPGQLSVISISDGVLPYQLYPQITHIRCSGTEMGTTAAALLLDNIKSKELTTDQVYISTLLVDLE